MVPHPLWNPQRHDFHKSKCLDVVNLLYCIHLGFQSDPDRSQIDLQSTAAVQHNDHTDRPSGTLTSHPRWIQ